jgi:hypothetical protein
VYKKCHGFASTWSNSQHYRYSNYTGNITLTNVHCHQNHCCNMCHTSVLGPITLAPGAWNHFNDSYVFSDSCGPYRTQFLAFRRWTSVIGRVVTSIDIKDCPSTNSPAIVVSKSCPPNPVPPGGIMLIRVSSPTPATFSDKCYRYQRHCRNWTHTLLGPINLAPARACLSRIVMWCHLNSCGPFRRYRDRSRF